MQLYVADYLGDTRHLTTEQHGAYLLLLMAMWRANGTLPAEDAKLARIVGLTAAKWKRISEDVMAFFQTADGQITQARLAEELSKANEKSIKRSASGKLGGEAKTLKTQGAPVANATVLLKHSSEPEPEKILEPTVPCPAKPNLASDDFEKAWGAYPDKGRQRSLSKAKTKPYWRTAAKAAGGADRLLGAIERFKREDETHKGDAGPKGFHLWLRDGRWEHWLPEARAPAALSAMSPELLAARRALLEQAPETPNA